MSDTATRPHGPAGGDRLRLGIGPGIVAVARGLAFFGLALAGLVLLFLLLAPFCLIGLAIWLFKQNGQLQARRSLVAGKSQNHLSATPGASPGSGRLTLPSGVSGKLSAVPGASPAPGRLSVPKPPGVNLSGHYALVPGQQWPRDFLPLALIAAALLIGWYLLPSVLLALRSLLNRTRQQCFEWCGVYIARPYRRPTRGTDLTSARRRLGWLLTDRATWRDLLWVTVNGLLGLMLALPAVLAGVGLIELVGRAGGWHVPPPGLPGHTVAALILLGAGTVTLGVLAGPWLLRGYGWLAHSMLAPTGQAELVARMEHLSQTRSETLDTGASEIRRIERDLHDGAQARLVAMGMTLSAAEQLVETSPQAARALLAEARDSSAKALAELRSLVRGIHPPVLADRGLAEASKALALDSPVRVQIASELAGRPPAPVESAAYFAVSELLANVAKHAGARQAWIDIRYSGGMLRIGVTDDGCGGADPARGSGLHGIERRLAAFDGVLAVSSPPGGPTTATMEIPCELSSPKISSY